MNAEERKRHAYLGDGVYAELTPNDIVLRTGNHEDYLCDNKIYIDQQILINLFNWIERMRTSESDSIVKNLPLEKMFSKIENRCDHGWVVSLKECPTCGLDKEMK